MPASSVSCPHCEKLVEIQVTAVTRSRACPECGELLMLQVAEKSGTSKRKALLVSATPPVDAPTAGEAVRNAYEDLPDAPFDRMRMDPALVAMRKRFLAGVAGVLVLIVIATVVHLMDFGRGTESRAPDRKVVEKTTEGPRIQHVQPAFSSVSLEERLMRLKSAEKVDPGNPDEKFVAPVFEIADGSPDLKGEISANPPVFEVSEGAGIVAPAP